MKIQLRINGRRCEWDVSPREVLLDALRRHGYLSVKRGCQTGECGTCNALVDGRLRPTCVMLAAQAEGREIFTVEGLAGDGRNRGEGLHPIQEAFLDAGAVQCGFCAPAMLLAAKGLLDSNPNPSEPEVREALEGVICRCTGYVKTVRAVLLAAARMRGETAEPPAPEASPGLPPLRVVGTSVRKLDGPRLVQGRPSFTADLAVPGTLHGRLLPSPHAHAIIKRIDASKARALPGVRAVLTHQDLPRVTYTSAGQSWPEPSPHDMRSLDRKVRYVGDRVAAVAADSPAIAVAALRLIEVDYEVLPAVLDPRQAMAPGAPVIHDEPDAEGFIGHDFARNRAARLETRVGDVEKGFAEADLVIERTYEVPKVQHVSLEPHVCQTYLDEDGRLVVRSSTQVPFHVRRIIAPLLGLPVKRIRVVKPRIGGGFGGKQEMLIEDLCAHLTLATGLPVLMEYTREEEFTSARSRHSQILTLKTGVKRDGTVVANELRVLANTGAYGGHAFTVQSNTGAKVLPLYRAPHVHYVCDVVYTNLPPAGAMRGYGTPQGVFALESQMDEIARELKMDPLDLRAKNWIRVGDANPLTRTMNEGQEGFTQVIHSCGLAEGVERGKAAIGWEEKRRLYGAEGTAGEGAGSGPRRRGVGAAVAMQGSGLPNIDMGGAFIKINDDGSFNLLVGATDLGTGADTVLAQIAAEVLGCRSGDIVVYASDTDLTPFDVGAYASSTTYISGTAVRNAAEAAAVQIREVAGRILEADPAGLVLRDRRVLAPDGRSVPLEQVALHALYRRPQQQIMGAASGPSPNSPPPFAVHFAEVEVDTETGEVRVLQMVSALDPGRAINPRLAEGQVEGATAMALGYATSEEMVWDEHGRMLTRDLSDYKVYEAVEMPRLKTILVQTEDPFGPFGAKAAAEVPINPVAPAIANAVAHATGVRVPVIPLTPERVLRALQEAEKRGGR